MRTPRLALLAFGILLNSHAAMAAAPPETHVFRVKVDVTYRCYGGYDPRKHISDSRTHVPCDNKTSRRTLVDKDVTVRIANEPTPDDDPGLAGDAIENVGYMGRKFTVAITLFKDFPANSGPVYRLRLLAEDDEPTARHSVFFARTDSSGNFIPVEIEYSSAGQPEEISMTTRIEEVSKKAR